MLELLKNPLVLVGLLCGVLLLVISRKSKQIIELKQEKAVANIEKELVHVKEKADQAGKVYKDAKHDYDQFKRDNPKLFE